MMNKLLLMTALLVLNACATNSDEEYIRCLQGFNDAGSGAGVPAGKAASVIAAGAAGAAASLVLCDEPEVTEPPQAIEAVVGGNLSQPIETREPLLVSKAPPALLVPAAPKHILFY